MTLRWFDGFKDFNKADLLQRLNIAQDGSLTVDGNSVSSGGSGNSILTFNTLTDLQTAYPNGTNVPVWVISDNCWYYWEAVADTTPPVITVAPQGSTYTSSQTVTITMNETATIYYTLDGSTPTTSSTKYTSPIAISSTETLKTMAVDTSGNASSVRTDIYTINIADTTPPVDVTGLTVGTVTATSIPLTWTKSTSSDVDHYEVAYSSNGGTSFTVASSAVNSSSTSYTISGLTASTSYTVRVVAIDTSGNRSTGVTKTATTATPTDTTPPNDVTNLTTSNVTSTSLTLSWTASNSSDIASYDVYQGSTLLGNTTNTTYNVSGLTASTQYTFKVVAKDASGNASTGVTTTVTTSAPADTTPPTVTISPAAGTYTSTQSVTLSGSDNSGGAVTIYYTTDGTTPTTSSTKYASAITVSATETIKYFGVDPSGNASSVQSATYTISSGAPSGYVNDSSLLLFQASPTKGETLDESVNSYFTGTSDWTFEIGLTQASFNSTATLLIERSDGSSSPIIIQQNYIGQWTVNLTGTAGGSAAYPQVVDPNKYTTGYPLNFHIQVVLDHTTSKTLALYVNGSKVASATISSSFTMNTDANPLKLTTYSAISSLKNLAYYNRALTSAELTQNYTALQ